MKMKTTYKHVTLRVTEAEYAYLTAHKRKMSPLFLEALAAQDPQFAAIYVPRKPGRTWPSPASVAKAVKANPALRGAMLAALQEEGGQDD